MKSEQFLKKLDELVWASKDIENKKTITATDRMLLKIIDEKLLDAVYRYVMYGELEE